jgi:hypothetical protein
MGVIFIDAGSTGLIFVDELIDFIVLIGNFQLAHTQYILDYTSFSFE